MQANVKINVAPVAGQVAVNIVLEDEASSPVIELLLEPWEALDIADELQHAANRE